MAQPQPPRTEGLLASRQTREALTTASSSARRHPRRTTEVQILEGAQELLNKADPSREGYVQLLTRACITTPLIQPFRYVQRLIQLGHEPFPPKKRFNFIFRRHLYYYPGVFSYARSIVKVDGWKELYRGVGALFVSDLVGMVTHRQVYSLILSAVNKIPMPFYMQESGDVPDTDPQYRDSLPYILTRASRMFLVSVTTNCVVQLAVHPFHVISMRSIAQYIGKETTYNGVLVSIKEIYQTEGLSGFYSGLVPALLGHLCTCVIHSSLWLMFEIIIANISHHMGKLVVKTFIAAPLLAYIPSSYSYPFVLMTNVMAVNNCGLAAGSPPRMPVFMGWRDCYRYLKASSSLYRGSAVLFSRYAYRDIP